MNIGISTLPQPLTPARNPWTGSVPEPYRSLQAGSSPGGQTAALAYRRSGIEGGEPFKKRRPGSRCGKGTQPSRPGGGGLPAGGDRKGELDTRFNCDQSHSAVMSQRGGCQKSAVLPKIQRVRQPRHEVIPVIRRMPCGARQRWQRAGHYA